MLPAHVMHPLFFQPFPLGSILADARPCANLPRTGDEPMWQASLAVAYLTSVGVCSFTSVDQPNEMYTSLWEGGFLGFFVTRIFLVRPKEFFSLNPPRGAMARGSKRQGPL